MLSELAAAAQKLTWGFLLMYASDYADTLAVAWQ
jgi:hypothetical protein